MQKYREQVMQLIQGNKFEKTITRSAEQGTVCIMVLKIMPRIFYLIIILEIIFPNDQRADPEYWQEIQKISSILFVIHFNSNLITVSNTFILCCKRTT